MAVADVKFSSTVQSFLSAPRKMMIDGNWVDSSSGKTFPVYNPAVGDVIVQVAEGEVTAHAAQ